MSKTNNNKQGNNRDCSNSNGGNRNNGKTEGKTFRGKQGRKDNKSRRVNLDNERESKFIKQYEKQGMRQKTSDGANDITWYARNMELLKSSASFPFNQVLGQSLRPGQPSYVQGAMVIYFTFAYGGIYSSSVSEMDVASDYYPEPINQAGKSMYSFLVHANSRNYVYEYQDETIVIAGGIQVFCAIAHAIRAFAFAKTYSEKSIYKPEAYLTAMGFDPDDFRNNLGQIWFDLNNLIAQTSQIWIPSEMPLIKRWIWMCSNIFTDAQSALGQSYLFVPQFFQQYNETGAAQGGVLEPATYKTLSSITGKDSWQVFDVAEVHQWNDWKNMIQHMIDRLVNSEDRGIMFGDILNAYGAERIFAMPPITADMRLEPVYSPEVLTQIENLTVSSAHCIGLKQDPSGLSPIMMCESTQTGAGGRFPQAVAPNTPILNFHQPAQPTPEQIVVATRLTTAGSITTKHYFTLKQPGATENSLSYSAVSTSAKVGAMPLSFGSELVSNFGFIIKDSAMSSGWSVAFYPWAQSFAVDPWKPFNTDRMVAGDYTSFDWAPFIYYLANNPDSATEGADVGVVVESFGDYDNFTVLNYYEIGKLHQMALMSEWGLPINY